MIKTYVQHWKSCLFSCQSDSSYTPALSSSKKLLISGGSNYTEIIRGFRGEPEMQSARCTRTTEKKEGTGESSSLGRGSN